MDRIIRWAKEHQLRYVDQVTPHEIREFLAELINANLESSYVNSYARVLRTLFNFLVAEEVISASPMERVKMPRVDKKILPPFSMEEITRLLATCRNARDRAVLLTLLDTGLRASELVHLTLGDVDLTKGRVMVHQGKGGRDRVVWLGQRSIDAIRAYMDERSTSGVDAPLFPSTKTGKPLKPSGLLQVCRRLGARADVHSHPHKFRRSFATWSLRNGMDLHAVQRQLGHANLHVILRYVNYDEADLAEAHRRYGPVDSVLPPDRTDDEQS